MRPLQQRYENGLHFIKEFRLHPVVSGIQPRVIDNAPSTAIRPNHESPQVRRGLSFGDTQLLLGEAGVLAFDQCRCRV
jgi:hypothetical protein